jgi:hypothetical protein
LKGKMSLKHLHQLRPTGECWGFWLAHGHCRVFGLRRVAPPKASGL